MQNENTPGHGILTSTMSWPNAAKSGTDRLDLPKTDGPKGKLLLPTAIAASLGGPALRL